MATRTRRTRGRSHGVVNIWLRGKSFYGEFSRHGNRYGPKSFGPVSRDVAERMAADWKRRVAEGDYYEASAPTFNTFAVEFLEWYRVGRRPGSVKQVGGTLRRLQPLWGPCA